MVRAIRMAGMVLAGLLVCLCAGQASRLERGSGWEKSLCSWKFSLGENQAASSRDFNDSGWEQVFTPHTFALEPRLYGKGESYFRGVGWYRSKFSLEGLEPAARLTLEFDGVMARAEVWLNGQFLGSHLGGFTPFEFDITAIADRSGQNLLAVKADNRRMEVPPDGLTADIDYPLYGGIYRGVRIIGREQVSVDDIYVTTPEVSGTSAKVAAAIKVRNHGPGPARFKLVTEIFEQRGMVRAGEDRSAEFSAGPGQSVEIARECMVAGPKLWSPSHPHLYLAKISILGADGKALSSAAISFGIRSLKFTPDQGFFLNGQPVKLIGFNRHQFYPYLGNAAPDRYQRLDAQLIKDSGANFVRLSHYPQAPAFLDALDQLGVMAYEELPGWHYLGDEEWKELAGQALQEMIIRDRSRPSIILWGVRINEAREDPAFTDRLNALAHSLDPTRPTTGARIVGNYQNFFEDVISLNDYSVGGVKPGADKPYLISESVGVNYQVGRAGKAQRVRNYVQWHLFIMDQVFANPAISGQAAWCIFDHHSWQGQGKIIGAPLELFHHLWHWGVMDVWRIPKDAYYVFPSQLLDTPFIRVVGNWDKKAGREVMVLHNCEEVELLLNGRSLGRQGPDRSFRPNGWIRGEGFFTSMFLGKYGVKRPDREIKYSLPHPPSTFKEVRFEPGKLETRCLMNGEAVAEYSVATAKAPARFLLEPDFAEIFADGSDMTRVVVKLVDEDNHALGVVSDSRAAFSIQAQGPGRILADKSPVLEGGMAAFFIQSVSEAAGELEVRVSGGGGIAPAQLTVKLLPRQ